MSVGSAGKVTYEVMSGEDLLESHVSWIKARQAGPKTARVGVLVLRTDGPLVVFMAEDKVDVFLEGLAQERKDGEQLKTAFAIIRSRELAAVTIERRTLAFIARPESLAAVSLLSRVPVPTVRPGRRKTGGRSSRRA